MGRKKIHIIDQDTEADTCRKEVLPKLYESGWDDDKLMEQREFTDGKIVVLGRRAKRSKGKKADYILRYSQNFPIAVVEAKSKYKEAEDGLQQAKDYAEILGLRFAYATNGKSIVEFDYTTGEEKRVEGFPTPDELWFRLNKEEPIQPEIQETFLEPFFPIPEKPVRYYQGIAINRAVKAVLEGRPRSLLTLATGTGKTTIAFQIIYKLWNNRWNRKGSHNRPKVLFLADRSVLVDDPHSKDFAVLGDARCLIPEEGLLKGREIYFSTYQSLAEDSGRVGAFREFSRDYFDLVVIDECHRGSATDNSNWRLILDYFNQAIHLGLTATPLRNDNVDTYAYFGNPLYTYSLKQGIEDGFLAPYVLHNIVPDVDARGWRPQEGQRDSRGQLISDGIYSTPDFETRLSLRPRTKAVARHLFDFMMRHGRFDKTIVFCVDQPHANQMRQDLNNLNKDLVKNHPNYVVRITSDEGDVGKGMLSEFMDIDEEVPVIVTTSRLLSTGVDVPTCKNIVLFREINSMTEFKQIIGRGTRLREDKDKLFFTILDYTGSAYRNFADEDFDGYPPMITNEEIDEMGERIEGTYNEEFPDPPEPEDWILNDPQEPYGEPPEPGSRKYYVEVGEVTIAVETVHILDGAGKLRTVKFTQYAKETLINMFPTVEEFKATWEDLEQRNNIIYELEKKGIDIEHLMDITNQQESDPFDLLCYVAFNLKPLTRKQRADLLKKNKPDLFAEYSDSAREIIDMIINKYIDQGWSQLKPEVIQVEPIASKGNVLEIAREFGGIEQLQTAIDQIQKWLYAA
ncbi:MAG: DEAD/DEAH box helicase family protein [Cytophagales bacterium]|nr:DEAD/DEAH box helicase family protein [Cytophagales bacterium]